MKTTQYHFERRGREGFAEDAKNSVTRNELALLEFAFLFSAPSAKLLRPLRSKGFVFL
jgi:hypothetical protein